MNKLQRQRLKALGVPEAHISRLEATGLPWAKLLKLLLLLLEMLTESDDD